MPYRGWPRDAASASQAPKMNSQTLRQDDFSTLNQIGDQQDQTLSKSQDQDVIYMGSEALKDIPNKRRRSKLELDAKNSYNLLEDNKVDCDVTLSHKAAAENSTQPIRVSHGSNRQTDDQMSWNQAIVKPSYREKGSFDSGFSQYPTISHYGWTTTEDELKVSSRTSRTVESAEYGYAEISSHDTLALNDHDSEQITSSSAHNLIPSYESEKLYPSSNSQTQDHGVCLPHRGYASDNPQYDVESGGVSMIHGWPPNEDDIGRGGDEYFDGIEDADLLDFATTTKMQEIDAKYDNMNSEITYHEPPMRTIRPNILSLEDPHLLNNDGSNDEFEIDDEDEQAMIELPDSSLSLAQSPVTNGVSPKLYSNKIKKHKLKHSPSARLSVKQDSMVLQHKRLAEIKGERGTRKVASKFHQSKSPLGLVHNQTHESDYLPKDFIRPAHPGTVCEQALIHGISNKAFIRTCFRIGEVINEVSRCRKYEKGRNVTIELFARLKSSHREPGTTDQYFNLVDMWHDRPPTLKGILRDYASSQNLDLESGALIGLPNPKLVRCLGYLDSKKDVSTRSWIVHLTHIRETDWNEIDWTRMIISGQPDQSDDMDGVDEEEVRDEAVEKNLE